MRDDLDLLRLTRRLHLQRHERVQPLRWRPPADIYRHRHGWLIKLELAGVAPEQIQIATSGRLLVVRGRRRDVTLHEGYATYAMEIVYSDFERVFELPMNLDHAELASDCRHGMLLITINMERTGP